MNNIQKEISKVYLNNQIIKSEENFNNISLKQSLIPFFVLSFILHICCLLIQIFIHLEPIQIIASFIAPWTPNIAAIIVVGLIIKEKSGIRKLFGGWKKWRVNFSWYLVALSPLAVTFSAVGLYYLLGGNPPGIEPLLILGPVQFSLGTLFGLIFQSLITGATGEELGWRGFALPRLQSRYNSLASSIILGIIWSCWHLPVWILFPQQGEVIPFWSFFIQTVAVSVIITWAYNNSGGSLVIVSLFHMILNFSLTLVILSGLIWYNIMNFIIFDLVILIYAILVVLFSHGMGSRQTDHKSLSDKNE